MGSTPKRQKLFEEVKSTETEDRISNLPSSVISHMLSFLPTKFAVRTSVLSTKWKQQWTSITNLDFSDCLISYTRIHTDIRLQMSFINFVYRALLLLKVPRIHKFHLVCGRDYDVSHLNAWISTALSRDVQELDICISTEKSNLLPCDLFACKTLLVLKLGTRFVLNVPTLVFLQNLKVLHLHCVEFFDSESTYRLFSSCPVLEDLAILGCKWKNISVFTVSAPALKKLFINHLGWNCSTTEFVEYRLVLDTPRLLHFEYTDYVAQRYTMENLHSLVEAHIDIELTKEQRMQRSSIHETSVNELAQGISNVQSLYLSFDYIQVFHFLSSKWPMFLKLTMLEYGLHEEVGCKLLPDLLESSPQLETLVLKCGGDGLGEFDLCHWYPPRIVPACLLFRLKTVKLSSFKGQSEELRLVEYFLKNAKVLKKLELYSDNNMTKEEESNTFKQLLAFARGSSTCQVVIY